MRECKIKEDYVIVARKSNCWDGSTCHVKHFEIKAVFHQINVTTILTPHLPTPSPAVKIDDPWKRVVSCILGAVDSDRYTSKRGILYLENRISDCYVGKKNAIDKFY